MLGKMMKYQLKALFKYMAPIYIGLLVVEFLLMTLVNFNDTFDVLILIAYGVLIVAAFVAILYFQVQYYWSNTYGQDAFFTRTLPVSEDAHVFSHMLTFFIGHLVTVIVAVLPWIYITSVNFQMFWLELADVFKQIGFLNNVFILLSFIISMVFSYLLFFFSEAVASLKPNHAILIGLSVFIVLSIVTTWILGQVTWSQSMEFVIESNTTPSGQLETLARASFGKGALVDIAVSVVFTFILYLGNKFFLKKHYNVQ